MTTSSPGTRYRRDGVRLSGSLSLRLFLWLSVITIAAFAGYTAITVRTTSEQWQQTVEVGSKRFSDLIKRATHYGMLLNRKQDVHYIIETIAREPGVEGVRVYDKNGTVMFSADSGEIGRQVDLRAQACVICHREGEPLQAAPESGRVRVFEDAEGNRILGLINPIENSPECSDAPCHAHPPDRTVLGVLDVTMSMSVADALLAETRRQTIVAAVIVTLLVGLSSTVFINRVVGRPVRRLIEGAERVAQGDLEARIDIGTGDEIGKLARTFNAMTDDLRRARDELTDWSHKLERKVVDKTEELSRTQRQVVHMEKMASLGKLSATVAHELNNPLAGILNYSKLVSRDVRGLDIAQHDRQEMLRCLELIRKEAGRSGDIVKNLLLFARSTGGDFVLHSIRQVVEWSVMLVRHHIEMSGVVLETRYERGDDRIVCDPDQIRQALVALLVNAVEAMPNGGQLTVNLEPRASDLQLTIADTGIGINPDDLPHVFVPFFSTKGGTSGVGLGLSVVYGIVQRHGGIVDVDSKVGEGATFTLTLPRRGAPVDIGRIEQGEGVEG